MRFAKDIVAECAPVVERFRYDRSEQAVGIVHFGIGAFHRAHMAWYTDRAMANGCRDWLISGVSLRSRTVAEQLNPQGGLYTLTERGGEGDRTRLIGAVGEVLFAPDDAKRVVARIADPACRIVSFTVTEKGYARASTRRLDLDLARASFYPLLTTGLARRKAAGLPGVTLLCCDNLAENGPVLRTLMGQWIAAEAPDLADWFDAECRVPATMVDRIVPRTDQGELETLSERIGLHDGAAVFTEPFSQWVVEDDFANGRPAWDAQGVELVRDVAPYERAKLRMLNGAHSLLAYCGLRAGHEFVHEAVADPALRALAEQLMLQEAATTVMPAKGQDLRAYAAQLLDRFANPALRHRLDQIAMDGTQKIPQRWLDTALVRRKMALDVKAIAEAFSAWLWHLEDGRFVDDPHGDILQRMIASEGRERVVTYCFDALWPKYFEMTACFAGAARADRAETRIARV